VLQPGDILYVRAGTYAEALINDIPSGTSWANPVTVAAYPGEAVTLQPAAGAGAPDVIRLPGPFHYILLNGLNLDGTNATGAALYIDNFLTGASDHIRFENAEIKNAPGAGVFVGASNGISSDYHEFINLVVHNNGAGTGNPGISLAGSHLLVDHV